MRYLVVVLSLLSGISWADDLINYGNEGQQGPLQSLIQTLENGSVIDDIEGTYTAYDQTFPIFPEDLRWLRDQNRENVRVVAKVTQGENSTTFKISSIEEEDQKSSPLVLNGKEWKWLRTKNLSLPIEAAAIPFEEFSMNDPKFSEKYPNTFDYVRETLQDREALIGTANPDRTKETEPRSFRIAPFSTGSCNANLIDILPRKEDPNNPRVFLRTNANCVRLELLTYVADCSHVGEQCTFNRVKLGIVAISKKPVRFQSPERSNDD